MNILAILAPELPPSFFNILVDMVHLVYSGPKMIEKNLQNPLLNIINTAKPRYAHLSQAKLMLSPGKPMLSSPAKPM